MRVSRQAQGRRQEAEYLVKTGEVLAEVPRKTRPQQEEVGGRGRRG